MQFTDRLSECYAAEFNEALERKRTATPVRVFAVWPIPANVHGTHFYYCHFQTHRHTDMGMYGVYRVDSEGYEPADREYFMTILCSGFRT